MAAAGLIALREELEGQSLSMRTSADSEQP